MAADLSIRPCRAEECPAVLALWTQAEAMPSATDTLEALTRLCREPTAAFLVAADGGRIVGSVVGGWDGWRGNIYRLAVAPEYRRRGLARRLVGEAERFMARKGARRISALVERDHPLAVGFWDAAREAGYRQHPRMIRYVKTLDQ